MGKYNSTRTRVTPLLDQLQKRPDWLNALLSTVNPNIRINEKVEVIYYGQKEKAMPPSKKLLVYLINYYYNILDKKVLISKNPCKRNLLFYGDQLVKQEALNLLKQKKIPKRGWFIFEGYTHPDIYIETKNYIIIGEAKRTESKLTTSTKWMKQRDQLIRHIDSVIDCKKKIISFFIFDQDVCKKYYKNALSEYDNLQYYKKNLPHRSDEEILRAMKSYIGFTYWDVFESKYRISF